MGKRKKTFFALITIHREFNLDLQHNIYNIKKLLTTFAEENGKKFWNTHLKYKNAFMNIRQVLKPNNFVVCFLYHHRKTR